MTLYCPAEGCNGEIQEEIVGNWNQPDVEHSTTCGHSVFRCANCYEWKSGVPTETKRKYYPAGTAGGGPDGSFETFAYCDECVNERCPICGGVRPSDSSRFKIELSDYTDSTAHNSEHNLCGDCWSRLLGEVDSQ